MAASALPQLLMHGDDIRIVPYLPAYKDQVLNLLRLNTPRYFDPSEEADLAYYLDHERELYYVVQAGTEIVGCGGINFANEGVTGKISWDILHPDYQGRSIGTQLLAFRIQQLESMGHIREIVVRTSQHAYRFYEKRGFRLDHSVQDYWASGIHLYYMILAHRPSSGVK